MADDKKRAPQEVLPKPTPYEGPAKNYLKLWPLTIKYDGIIDWEGLYRLIADWYIDRGYYFEQGDIKHKVPTPAGAQDEYKFTGWKKTTQHLVEKIDLQIILYDLKEIDVIKDGKKKKLIKARMVIYFAGGVETAYDPRWDQTTFGRYLRTVYEKLLIKKDMEALWWDRLYYIRYKLHTEIKKFLEMQARENAYFDSW